MAEKMEVYKCLRCGIIVEVLKGGPGELTCCDQPMEKLNPKTEDQGLEKHVPIMHRAEGRVIVKVGEVPHPMEDTHHIEWIELIAGDEVFRKHLRPGDEPRAEFITGAKELSARELCNLHGLWITR
jgi:superoxide reductase